MENKYNLGERTEKFGDLMIEFCKSVPESFITRPLIIQLIKAGTSVGANYAEADDAVSKNDFKHKIGICKKEARECIFFLRMISKAVPNITIKANILIQEAKELNLIFNAIFKKL